MFRILFEFRSPKPNGTPEPPSHKIERLKLRYSLLAIFLYHLGTYLRAEFFH